MPRVLLEGQRKLWGDLWTKKGKGDVSRFPQGGESSWEVRACPAGVQGPTAVEGSTKNFPGGAEAVEGFKWPAATGVPELPPCRHFGLLSNEALAVLSKILQVIELLGIWPTQVSQLVVAMLEKPTGGFRPIGIFPGIYRLWMKARAP
eukprot:13482363-Heterocapsa_arctica.AAC.1